MKKARLTAAAFELAAREYYLTGGNVDLYCRLAARLQERYGWSWEWLDDVDFAAQVWADKVHKNRHRRYRTERVRRGLA